MSVEWPPVHPPIADLPQDEGSVPKPPRRGPNSFDPVDPGEPKTDLSPPQDLPEPPQNVAEFNLPPPPEGSPPGLPALPSVEDFQKPPEPEPADARKFAIGDVIDIEVLEAMPGRPITGERLVRPDGTVSLGFYGDLKVAGLTRREVKVKVVEHLREFLSDQALGLILWSEREKRYFWVHPARTNRIYVDDSPNFARNDLLPLLPSGAGPFKTPGATIQPGDRLKIRVPGRFHGRQIEDVRVVGPDGSIKLEGYGDFKVGGLTPAAARANLIEHVRQAHPDRMPYAVKADETTIAVEFAPIPGTVGPSPPRNPADERIDALERKLDRVLSELEALRK